MQRLTGKVAVVTGASRGIGRAVAIRLAAEGAAVAVNYRADRGSAESLVTELSGRGTQAMAFQADVSEPDQIGRLMDSAAQTLGGLDILVSNAGIEHFGALEDITPADFDRVFATNTRGQLFAVQHAARHLGPGGHIVLTSSISAHKSVFHHTLYAASKAAVEAMALNLAAELGQRQITINAIAPGGTNTDMSAKATPPLHPPRSAHRQGHGAQGHGRAGPLRRTRRNRRHRRVPGIRRRPLHHRPHDPHRRRLVLSNPEANPEPSGKTARRRSPPHGALVENGPGGAIDQVQRILHATVRAFQRVQQVLAGDVAQADALDQPLTTRLNHGGEMVVEPLARRLRRPSAAG